MPQSLQDELSPIFERLVLALVEATPEWWKSAELILTVQAGHLGAGLAHMIQSAEYPRDIVVATDEMYIATREMELLCARHHDSWRRCVFRIAQEPSGAWKFSVAFER
jgi:hypothetical protein